MRKLSHNKRRNVGLVYEFLSRVVTEAVMAKDQSRTAAALAIVSEHLAEGCPLYSELSLHRQVMETKGVSERLARRIVDELKAAGVRTSAARPILERAKTELIHEMNRALGREVFDRYRIPDYTAHASVSILMTRGMSGRIDEGVDLARVEDHLLEYLTRPASEAVRYDPDASLYAYKTAVGLFEQEFGRELTSAQAELLQEYVRVSLGGNPAPFERTFERQRRHLHEALRTRRTDDVFRDDAEMATRLDEALAELDGLRPSVDDEAVESLLLFHNLHREVFS
jgi:hypothetical protein